LYERGAETGVVVFGPADDLGAAAELKQQLEPVAARVELASAEDLNLLKGRPSEPQAGNMQETATPKKPSTA